MADSQEHAGEGAAPGSIAGLPVALAQGIDEIEALQEELLRKVALIRAKILTLDEDTRDAFQAVFLRQVTAMSEVIHDTRRLRNRCLDFGPGADHLVEELNENLREAAREVEFFHSIVDYRLYIQRQHPFPTYSDSALTGRFVLHLGMILIAVYIFWYLLRCVCKYFGFVLPD
ncbi:hypothetical protein F4780DRAFT_795166 [Xylariomycetidae sp. FL0641]|nr:hypothetical protein F4780DRAFT_795166 [Xylariomycetidae sp. FL0641]